MIFDATRSCRAYVANARQTSTSRSRRIEYETSSFEVRRGCSKPEEERDSARGIIGIEMTELSARKSGPIHELI